MPRLLYVLFVVVLAACVAAPGPSSTSDPTIEPTPTIEATAEPTPTIEPTLEPTLAPTAEPTLRPTPEPTPTPEPSGPPFSRHVVDGVGQREHIAVEVLDRSHAVTAGHPADGNELRVAPDPAGTVGFWNPGGDRRRLGLVWAGGMCDTPALLSIDAPFDRVVLHQPSEGNCDAIGFPRALVLELSRPIDAASLTAERGDRAEFAACPTVVGDLVALVTALDRRVRVGSVVTEDVGIASVFARYPAPGFGGSDQVGSWPTDPRDPALTVGAGRRLFLAPVDPTLWFTAATVQVFRRAATGIAPEGEPLSYDRVERGATGLFLDVPRGPGRYVLRLFPEWAHACLTGGGLFELSIDVE